MPHNPVALVAPCALSIAGLDPSGGAGVLADVRAFEAAGAWGCAVVAVSTVQSTAGLRESHPVPASLLRDQVREILLHQRVRAIKLGALGSAANVRAVAAEIRRHPKIPTVLDPVMVATIEHGSSPLLAKDALDAVRSLLRGITLVTPNAPEAALLLNQRVGTLEEARTAARALVAAGAKAALVKGGHLGGSRAVDVLLVGDRFLELSSPRTPRARVHGTGCTLASLIAGRIAKVPGSFDESELARAVRWAKGRVTRAITHPLRIGRGATVLRP